MTSILQENEGQLFRFFQCNTNCDGEKFFAKVERLPLDNGGYTANGTYFGKGYPLFSVSLEVQDSTTRISWVGETEFRATTYQTARTLVKAIGKKLDIDLHVDR